MMKRRENLVRFGNDGSHDDEEDDEEEGESCWILKIDFNLLIDLIGLK